MHSPASNNDKDPYEVKCHIRAQCARVRSVLWCGVVVGWVDDCDNLINQLIKEILGGNVLQLLCLSLSQDPIVFLLCIPTLPEAPIK